MHAGTSACRTAPACRQPFPYSRCSAAAALEALCACDAGRDEVRAGGGVALLKALLLQAEEDAGEAAGPGAGAPGKVPNSAGPTAASAAVQQRAESA